MNYLTIPGVPNPYDTLPELSKSVLSKVKNALGNIESREQVFSTLQRMGSQALINACQEDCGNDQLFKSLPKEMQYRVAYIPYVIAELAWDYADTITKLSANLKFSNKAKRLSNEIKKLRLDYERLRAPVIDKERRNSEVENMYVFEDETQAITKKLIINLRCRFGGLDKNSMLYLIAVCQCEILLMALFRYCNRLSVKISAISKRKIDCPLPEQISSLLSTVTSCYKIIPNTPDIKDIKKQYSEIFTTQIGLIELENLPE